MTSGTRIVLCFVVVLVTAAAVGSPASAQVTFTNNTPIIINEVGPATPYPSSIVVAGYTGTVTNFTVTLTGFSHIFTDDLASVVTGPGTASQGTLLFSGPGGDTLATGTTVTNIDLIFDDAAAATLPISSDFGSGTYRPGLNQWGDILAPPAPQGPYATDFNPFLGQSPDGVYSLYIQDFLAPDDGSVQSWSITLHGITPIPEPATLLVVPALLFAGAGLVRRLHGGQSEKQTRN